MKQFAQNNIKRQHISITYNQSTIKRTRFQRILFTFHTCYKIVTVTPLVLQCRAIQYTRIFQTFAQESIATIYSFDKYYIWLTTRVLEFSIHHTHCVLFLKYRSCKTRKSALRPSVHSLTLPHVLLCNTVFAMEAHGVIVCELGQ